MALRDSVLEGFQVGQATGSGGSGVESFIKVLNDRIEGQNKFRAGVAQEVEAKRQTIPLELEKERQLLQEKNKLGMEASTSAIERFKTLQGTQGGFAPGSTMQFDPVTGETKFNIQLNPALDQVEGAARSTAETLLPELRSLKEGLKTSKANIGLVEGPLSHLPGVMLEGARQYLPLSSEHAATLDRSQQVKGLVNRLKLSGFMLGGKQLTDRELQIIVGLIDPTGKPQPIALKDLEVMEQMMLRSEANITQGTNAPMDFAQLLAESGGAVPPDLASGEPTAVPANVSTGAASEQKLPAQGTPAGQGIQDLRTQALQKLQERRARTRR